MSNVLNIEFQHFRPRFDKNFITLQIPLKEGFEDEKKAQRQGEDKVTLRMRASPAVLSM
jgi:hypothetical protein